MAQRPTHDESALASFDAVNVLVQGGDDRDRLLCAVSPVDERALDAALVAAVVRDAGRALETARHLSELAVLCAAVRSVRAALDGHIDLVELRRGLAARASTSDRFKHFGPARVLLRTLLEVLDVHGAGAQGRDAAVRRQVELLHAELVAIVDHELLGDAPASSAPRPTRGRTAVAGHAVADRRRRTHLAELAQQIVNGAEGYPVAGVAASAWRRGYSAAPLYGDRFGDEDHAAPARLARYLAEHGDTEAVCIDLVAGPGWRVVNREIELLDTTPASRDLAVAPHAGTLYGSHSHDLASAALHEPRGRCVFTDDECSWFVAELGEYHVVAGPRGLVEATCGHSVHDALAAFRDHVERLTVEDEAPADLAEAARVFGRMARRGIGT